MSNAHCICVFFNSMCGARCSCLPWQWCQHWINNGIFTYIKSIPAFNTQAYWQIFINLTTKQIVYLWPKTNATIVLINQVSYKYAAVKWGHGVGGWEGGRMRWVAGGMRWEMGGTNCARQGSASVTILAVFTTYLTISCDLTFNRCWWLQI